MNWLPSFLRLFKRPRRPEEIVPHSFVLERLDEHGLHVRLLATAQVQAALADISAANGDVMGEFFGILNKPVADGGQQQITDSPPKSAPATAIEQQAGDALLSDPDEQTGHRFIVDAPFLLQSARFILSQGQDKPAPVLPAKSLGPVTAHQSFKEYFHYAAGIRVNAGTFVINRIVPVHFSEQSQSGVKVDNSSNILALARLDSIGLPLIAHFHSHPGFGPGINHPSGTDQRFQESLERGGHIAIGGIFSRADPAGFVFLRFFAGDNRDFQIEVQGNHVDQVEERLFRLSLANGRAPSAIHGK